jgi:tyrosyl-tRNA synthetase
MLERDMFEKRTNENKPIFLHEFMYPLMQGYDSVAMDVDVEVGGNDQTFNMLAGRTLQKAYRNKNKFVVATTLLVNPKTGKKLMNKSEGSYIALDDSPREMFGKVMALPDEVIIPVFTDCTYVSMEEIMRIKTSLASGANPRDAKLALAHALVSLYHDEKSADKEKENFFKTFSNKEAPTDIPEIFVESGTLIGDTLVSSKTVSSKAEFKRLVQEGAIKDMKTDKALEKFDEKASTDRDLKVGKHRFLRIRVK